LAKSKEERTDYVTGEQGGGDAQASPFMTVFKQVLPQGINALLVRLKTIIDR
jgi:hypothetical protein